MKAITLYQPWASLIAWEEKRYETRSWYTPHRGLIAIHAGRNTEMVKALATEFGANRMYEECGFAWDFLDMFLHAFNKHAPREPMSPLDLSVLPLGAVVALADVADCIRMTPEFIRAQTGKELEFGDWQSGRYAWKLVNIRPFALPVLASGKQGLWDWTPPHESEVSV